MHRLRAAIRVAVAWVAFLVATAVVIVTGIGGRDFGVAACMVVLAVAGALFARLAARGVLSIERTRAAALGGMFLGLAVGLYVGVTAPPAFARVGRAFAALEMPPGLRLVATRRVGNALCLDTCPSYLRRYETAQLGPLVADAVRGSLRAQGFAVTTPRTGALLDTTFAATRGRREVDVVVSTGASATTVQLLLTLR